VTSLTGYLPQAPRAARRFDAAGTGNTANGLPRSDFYGRGRIVENLTWIVAGLIAGYLLRIQFSGSEQAKTTGAD